MSEKLIKLKENYQIIRNPQNPSQVFIYDKNKEMVFLKFSMSSLEKLEKVDFNRWGQHFQSLQILKSSIEGNIIISLYNKYPDLFISNNNSEDLMIDAKILESENIINYNHFYSTYQLSNHQYDSSRIFLWGASQTNLLVFHQLMNLSIDVTLIVSLKEKLTPYENILSGRSPFQQVPDFINSVKDHYNLENKKAKILIFEKIYDFKTLAGKNVIHIVDNKILDKYVLPELFNRIESSRNKGILYYGSYENELVIGPLVFSGETVSYSDFLFNYDKETKAPSSVLNFLAAGMIQRVISYLNADSLKYLSEDAQLPLNAVFCIDKFSLNSRIIQLKREVLK